MITPRGSTAKDKHLSWAHAEFNAFTFAVPSGPLLLAGQSNNNNNDEDDNLFSLSLSGPAVGLVNILVSSPLPYAGKVFV